MSCHCFTVLYDPVRYPIGPHAVYRYSFKSTFSIWMYYTQQIIVRLLTKKNILKTNKVYFMHDAPIPNPMVRGNRLFQYPTNKWGNTLITISNQMKFFYLLFLLFEWGWIFIEPDVFLWQWIPALVNHARYMNIHVVRTLKCRAFC